MCDEMGLQTTFSLTLIRCFDSTNTTARGGGRGVLPSKMLLEMCRWIGFLFHNCTDYNGVTLLVELLE